MKYLLAVLLVVWNTLLLSPAQAQVCVPSCSLAGVVNDYWPATSDAAVGAASVTLGPRRAGGAGATISVGDLLLVIQMQDATINTANTAAYGSGGAGGNGYLAARQTGFYQYLNATNAVGAGGGPLTFSPPLINAYNATVTGPGAPTYQVIRVPNCEAGTLTATVTGLPWSSSTGGVVALRAADLNMNGQTINADNLGFRGGASEAHNNPVNTDNWASNLVSDQFKGEGIAGTPQYLVDLTTAALGVEITATVAAFPGGNRARGAPGNAGGGGEGDSGSGGGGNGGPGGVGGVWDAGIGANGGGRGGAVFAERAFTRLVMGGGGGGGGAGPRQEANAINVFNEANPPAGNGTNAFSRGGAGGGIVILNTINRTGGLTINASGQSSTGTFGVQPTPIAPDINLQVSGGGGAGGSVVLYGAGGTINVNAIGGAGGVGNRVGHFGQGGGGGGGVVFAQSAAGVTAVTTGGVAGCTRSGGLDSQAAACSAADAFSSTAGGPGPALLTFAGPAPGNPRCSANVSINKSNAVGTLLTGQTTSYTVTVANFGPNAANNSLLQDLPSTGLNCTAVSCTASTPSGLCPLSAPISSLLGSGVTLTSLPANSTLLFSVTCGVTATGQ